MVNQQSHNKTQWIHIPKHMGVNPSLSKDNQATKFEPLLEKLKSQLQKFEAWIYLYIS
jgi:ABC-type phosphate/phosphonate transport system substrate-binding protein